MFLLPPFFENVPLDVIFGIYTKNAADPWGRELRALSVGRVPAVCFLPPFFLSLALSPGDSGSPRGELHNSGVDVPGSEF